MTAKGKDLTQEDRPYIEDALNESYSLTDIAKRLGKDPTTWYDKISIKSRVNLNKGL